MRKLFLLVYNDEVGSRETIKKAIDECPLVITWRSDLPNSFYLISESKAKDIATALREATGKGKFVLAEVGSDYWGWNTPETWYLFANKKNKPKS